MRKAVLAAVAILVVGGVAILSIVLAPTGSTWVAPDLLAPGSGGSLPPGALPPRPPSTVPIAGFVPVEPSPPQLYEPAPPKPPPGSWEAVAVSARAGALGPVGVAVSSELGELQPQLSECFEEVAQSRYGQVPFSRTSDFTPPDGTGTPILQLQLEMSAGQVRIVDAPVDAQGRASDGLVACAQSVLRGRVVAAPGAKPGDRARLLFQLLQ